MKRSASGFSLVEMLVALTIFSMLVSVLIVGYSQGLLLWEKGKRESFRWTSLENRHELLRRLFWGAIVADYQGEPGISYPHFVADQHGIEFMSRAPILELPGHVRPVRVLLQRNESGASILYEEAGRYQDLERGTEWNANRQVGLLTDITNPTLRFLAPAFPLPPELAIAELSESERLRYRDEAEWLNWYNAAVLWRLPLQVEVGFIDDMGYQHSWMFQLPAESDAWSLRGTMDDVP